MSLLEGAEVALHGRDRDVAMVVSSTDMNMPTISTSRGTSSLAGPRSSHSPRPDWGGRHDLLLDPSPSESADAS